MGIKGPKARDRAAKQAVAAYRRKAKQKPTGYTLKGRYARSMDALGDLAKKARGKKLPEDVIGTTKTRSRHVKRILEWLKFEPHDYGWLLPLKKGKK